MASAITALATTTLGSAASSVTFGSIPATYRDLRLVIGATLSAGATNGFMQVNGDTGTNYNRVQMIGNGSTTSTYAASGDNGFYAIQFAGTGSVGTTTMDFLDYSVTDKHKTILIRSNDAGSQTLASANRWGSTSGITSFVVSPGSGTFAAGSTFSLYGIVS